MCTYNMQIVQSPNFSSSILDQLVYKFQSEPYKQILRKIEENDYQKVIKVPETVNLIKKNIDQKLNTLTNCDEAYQFCKNVKQLIEQMKSYFTQLQKFWNQISLFLSKIIKFDFHKEENYQSDKFKQKISNKIQNIYTNGLQKYKNQLQDQGGRQMYIQRAHDIATGTETGSRVGVIVSLAVGILNPLLGLSIFLGSALVGSGSHFVNQRADQIIDERAQIRFNQQKEKTWILFKKFLDGQITNYQLKQQIQKNGYGQYFMTVKQQLKTNISEYIKNFDQQYLNFDISIKFDKDLVRDSIKTSWLFFKNILIKTLKSKTQYSKSFQAFIKTSLNNVLKCKNNSYCIFPGIIVGRLTKGNSKARLYYCSQQSYDFCERLILQKLNNQNIKVKVTQNDLKDERTGYQVNGQYKVSQIQILNHEQLDFQTVIQIIKNLIVLISKIKIAAVVFGDTSLLGSDKIFLPKHNRYYLKDRNDNNNYQGFQRTIFTALMRGDFEYFCPGGWLRMSLNVAKDQKQFDQKYGNWRVAYMGTGNNFGNLFSILTTGFRCAIGCYSWDWPVTYCTPSIQYAAMYGSCYFDQKLQKWVQLVLQLKVNQQKIYKKGKSTLPNLFKGDPNFTNKYQNQYQWLLKGKTQIRKKNLDGTSFKIGYKQNLFQSDGIIPYGIMLRLSENKPATRKQQNTLAC